MNSTHHHITPDYGTGQKKFSIYLTGFVLCIILTLIPFAAVIYGHFSHPARLWIVFGSAFIQFFVQVLCFLRLNTSTPQARMNVLSFILSIVILTVIIGGSLWIMWSLNYRMMH